jgi:hypothetical protein
MLTGENIIIIDLTIINKMETEMKHCSTYTNGRTEKHDKMQKPRILRYTTNGVWGRRMGK